MARETIASVKRELQNETRRLNGIIAGEAAAHKVQLELAEDANARLITAKADVIRENLALLTIKDDKIAELIREKRQIAADHSIALAAKDARIDELFQSNNEYQADARAARAEVVRLQQSLSDASRVIATLGQRAF